MLNDILVDKLQLILKEDFNKDLKKEEVAKVGETLLKLTKLLLKIKEESEQKEKNYDENYNKKQSGDG